MYQALLVQLSIAVKSPVMVVRQGVGVELGGRVLYAFMPLDICKAPPVKSDRNSRVLSIETLQ